jgi:hypothetical protein
LQLLLARQPFSGRGKHEIVAGEGGKIMLGNDVTALDEPGITGYPRSLKIHACLNRRGKADAQASRHKEERRERKKDCVMGRDIALRCLFDEQPVGYGFALATLRLLVNWFP